jgi:leucyl-tRNA synthetase
MAPPADHVDNATATDATNNTAFRYTAALAADIEARWQDRWDADGTYEAPNPAGPLAEPDKVAGRPKLYVLDMFPYPSGDGLHVGHPLGYIGTDVYARFNRMTGHNVLHALGYDAFGLPAEQFAIRTGTHPRLRTEQNIANMRRQLRRLGLGHDPRRSVATTDEAFYKWTQWIFLQVFNSWYDAARNKARPITELIAEFETGTRTTSDGRAWSALSKLEQRKVVDDHRLVYVAETPVNWCPGMGTVLANEEVTAEGRSDIGNFPVFKRNMRQWMMRITTYAERLLDDLDRLDWTDSIKLMQRNWIGRSEGARVRFASTVGDIEIFTTRPDTLFGATFMVLSPEHPMVGALTTSDQRDAIAAYRLAASQQSDMAREEDTREKTGVFTGSFATNPVNGAAIPVWIADYVLMGYGTGAIMAVPCGDQRDFEFARRFGLPIPAIQQPPADWFAARAIDPTLDTAAWPEAFAGDGTYVESANHNGLDLNGPHTVSEAKHVTNAWLTEQGHGEGTINYKLRDWLFARQRYWGEPFPIVWDEHGPIALPNDMLPVLLPEVDDYKPQALDPDDASSNPTPPLSRATHWTEVTLDLGDGPQVYQRDLNVMPQWAGSCWYEMRYLDPTNENTFIDPAVEQYWMGKDPSRPNDPGGVDLYVGGVEHAVLHLLYARFWHKVLFDLGHVSSEEPFRRLFNQGYIQAYAYTDARGQYVNASEVTDADGAYSHNGEPVKREYGKMGKRLLNIVTPDEMYDAYGADTFRLYEMAMGPLDVSRPWATRDVIGMQRFLQRLWRNLVDEATGNITVVDAEPSADTTKALHRAIDGVRNDMANLRFNTAIAKLIELNNHLTGLPAVPRSVANTLVTMLAPLAPHVAEELWQKLGHADTIVFAPFPEADPIQLVDDSVEIPVQINGKVRGRVTVPTGTDNAAVQAAALADDKVITALDGATPKKVIVIAGKLVNIVV